MKSIKVSGILPLIGCALVVVVFLNACSSDNCKNVNCQNGGTCNDGTCACATGYEGTDCSVLSIQKFLGSWAASDVCNTGNYSYTVTVTASPTITIVLINNFGNFGVDKNVNATVEGSSLIVPQQVVGGITFSGNGAISADGRTVTLTYEATKDTTLDDNCTSTWALK